MYEKVNPSHPDKIADRIAGALVDLSYREKRNPHVAVEVLIGHGVCHIINETDTPLNRTEVEEAVSRIVQEVVVLDYDEVAQDRKLNENQREIPRCGDNGIFRGVPTTHEQALLAELAAEIYELFPYDGKYLLHGEDIMESDTEWNMTVCQSFMTNDQAAILIEDLHNLRHINNVSVNPLGEWTGGIDVDCGATNRKLGSDMGDAVTGGGLHGKDLSKADVSVNIVCHLIADERQMTVEAICSIGDTEVTFMYGNEIERVSFDKVVERARDYINECGGFERFAEWGLI